MSVDNARRDAKALQQREMLEAIHLGLTFSYESSRIFTRK
jgi:hypothetical protein